MSQNQREFRIGYVVHSFPALFATSLLNELLALEARGIPLHIFSLERPRDPRFHEDLSQLKASITFVPEATGWTTLLRHNAALAKRHRWKHLWTLTRALFTGRPKLLWRFWQAGYVARRAEHLGLNHLHAHTSGRASTVAFLASRMTGIPFSFSALSGDIFGNQVSGKALARKMGAARFVTTPSESNRKYLSKLSPETVNKVFTVYPGIRLDRFSPGQTPPPSPFRFVCVAGLEEHKGIPILVKACRRLLDRGVEFQVDILGTGPRWNHLRNIIRGSDLHSHVHLLGPKTHSKIVAYLQRSHAFVLPSVVGEDGNRDILPVTLLEALACGLPVIASNLAGIPEVVKQGENGLLVKSQDPQALADSMESVVKEPQLLERLKTKTHASVAGRFGHDRIAAGLHHILEETAARVPPPSGLRARVQGLGNSLADGTTRIAGSIPGRDRIPARRSKSGAG